MINDAIASRIANQMRRDAQQRKIRVVEDGFVEGPEVFASENPQEVAHWLINRQVYGLPPMLDGGLHINLPDGNGIFQGPKLDRWIDENRALINHG